MKKCCVATLITILVIVVLLGVGVVVLLNLTPQQLNLAEVQIGDNTLAELGLADVKILDIIKGFAAMAKDPGNLVTNGYEAEQESVNAEAQFSNSTMAFADDYSALLSGNVVYDNQYKVTYQDTTIAYIFDKAVYGSSQNDDYAMLREADLHIAELSVSKVTALHGGVDLGQIRIVLTLDMGKVKDSLGDSASVADSISTSGTLYIVATASFEVDKTGEQRGLIRFSPQSISINGNENNPVANAVFAAIASGANLQVENGDATATVNKALFDSAARFINHLGLIGTVSATDQSGRVVGMPQYGLDAVGDHAITFITYNE